MGRGSSKAGGGGNVGGYANAVKQLADYGVLPDSQYDELMSRIDSYISDHPGTNRQKMEDDILDAFEKSKRDYLEKSWGGSGIAKNPTELKKGDIISEKMFDFPNTKGVSSAWQGNNSAIEGVGDLKIKNIKGDKYMTTIIAETSNGSVVTKTVGNGVYLKVLKRGKK